MRDIRQVVVLLSVVVYFDVVRVTQDKRCAGTVFKYTTHSRLRSKPGYRQKERVLIDESND